MKKTKKNYKQKDSDTIHGKRRFRLRKDIEKEGQELVKEFKSDQTVL